MCLLFLLVSLASIRIFQQCGYSIVFRLYIYSSVFLCVTPQNWCACVLQLPMHLNSSLHQAIKTTRRPFVVSVTALEIWSFISTSLPSLLHPHIQTCTMGCCCKSYISLYFQKLWSAYEATWRIQFLFWSEASQYRGVTLLNLTSKSMTHTPIKTRRYPKKWWYFPNLCFILHWNSLIHKKHFPAFWLFLNKQLKQQLWRLKTCELISAD